MKKKTKRKKKSGSQLTDELIGVSSKPTKSDLEQAKNLLKIYHGNSKYKPRYCEELIAHMSKGLSFKSFAATVYVNRSVLYEWMKVHPEFRAAKEIADERCRLFWEVLGVQIATGQKENANPAVWIYNMRNRFSDDWTPKNQIDISARYEQDVKRISNMSAQELAEAAKQTAEYLENKSHEDQIIDTSFEDMNE